ncbi:tyrosine-protein phosphatase 69D [Scaptodrosophila lebanonensis]|uniref:protein-tyrosine-phosphatase n=1 Tax=Drosophila lebanonensis TaxID=7225 RepID=A0A6J2TK01_DROLE|nr:tyrosine-protein phosphatase 69D [Scaptodrosophila lebanonensis]
MEFKNSLTLTAQVFLLIFLSSSKWALGHIRREEWAEIGKNWSLLCRSENEAASWIFNNNTIEKANRRYSIKAEMIKTDENLTNKFSNKLTIHNLTESDTGSYFCDTAWNNHSIEFKLQTFLHPTIVESTPEKIKCLIEEAVELYCLIRIYPQNTSIHEQLKWLKDGSSFASPDNTSAISSVNVTHLNFTQSFVGVNKKDNGTYKCVLYNEADVEITSKEITLLILDVPQVSIDYAKAVGANRIYLNWTVNNGNDPIQNYFVQYSQEGSPSFIYHPDFISGNNTSYVLGSFQPNTTYILRISAKNSRGRGTHHTHPNGITTLTADPVFIPKVETTGSTASTITIGWSPPPQELLEYIQYYELMVSESGEVPKLIEETVYQQNSRNLPYMFDNLKTATDYEFKVRACSDLTKICGPWSEVVNGTTMDGAASKPTDLTVHCHRQNISRLNSISISWNVPNKPNGKIVSYLITIEGSYQYSLPSGVHTEKLPPKIRRIDEPNHKTVYDGADPNTNYTVAVSAITRHKKTGELAHGNCSMPVSVPTVDRTMWTKVKLNQNEYVIKLYLPKISERNGPICCYRIYLIKLKNGNKELPTPDKLDIATYHQVHNDTKMLGDTYIAEMISKKYFKSEIFLGDGVRFIENSETLMDNDNICRRCLEGTPFLRKQEKVHKSANDINPILSQKEQLTKAGNLTEHAFKILENKKRKRRNPKAAISKEGDTNLNLYNQSFAQESAFLPDIWDGKLDINSNYTGFLEVIVPDGNSVLMAYSDYFAIITPATEAEQLQNLDDSDFYYMGVKALAVVIAVTIMFIIIWFLYDHKKSKNAIRGEDAITLRDSLRALFGGRSNNHSHFISSGNNKGFESGPIHKSDLINAYKSRHKDTDYGFLREYEMLPNRFSDRTTKNTDLKENAPKNRYPDIKAYDQTRVKLSPINGLPCSDYINANFVIGYKERKKFICAQGPMEGTIDDFWRMIWEQHLEIIVMLTNLEEYNKAKCAKYWPEKVQDTKKFGDISVKFTQERKTGDYLIRSLDVSKTNLIGEEEDHREITQYHYLTWKDFMAPEHPHGIIKFIRQINSVYSVQRGPILVHCSAGVGRTGTLVALDSLTQQLEEEDTVSIFNTVCDLRHQRNFLVQSLKQYIFLYRALLDTATYGNTEIAINSMPQTIESLKTKPADGSKCKLEIEFEKLLSTTEEVSKSCCIGESEENMSKNRSQEIIPYDRNRVILSPAPMKENSTYINASFIEGYDNTETFIITQDPLENTIVDFWRMISEQSVSTLIMISEIGDGPRKCPRYWADDEIQYDHILVKYVHSESCPYYTRREFHVTNCKIDDTLKVTQFQYNGWPTVDGEVPEVCRGIIELVDQAYNHYNSRKNSGCRSPLTVHCSLGTDRSSIFVAMCILVQHLRLEKNIDICSTTRKIRSQRPGLINSYAQYEFLHRAIINYSDLHNLSENSSD